jgi:hypothetical protein
MTMNQYLNEKRAHGFKQSSGDGIPACICNLDGGSPIESSVHVDYEARVP